MRFFTDRDRTVRETACELLKAVDSGDEAASKEACSRLRSALRIVGVNLPDPADPAADEPIILPFPDQRRALLDELKLNPRYF